MRKYFAQRLYQQMKKDPNIWVITGDLGYKMWDKIRDNFPDRFVNVGVAEPTMIGLAVGLALEGKKPFVFSITPFLIYRPFEALRNYVDREKIPVRLIASGRNKDYSVDGFSHWAEEDKKVMRIFKNIKGFWPENEKELSQLIDLLVSSDKPYYLNLKR